MKVPIEAITSNPEPAIPFIFLAEGFTEAEMDVFDMYVQHAIDAFTATEPYATNIAKLNFYKAKTISKESGTSIRNHISRQVTPSIKDTYFKVYRNNIGVERLLNIPDVIRNELYKALGTEGKIFEGKDFYPVIIVNDTFYAGRGEFKWLMPSLKAPDNMAVAIMSIADTVNNFKFLVLHETAHTFGDLDDEYEDADFAKKAPSYNPDIWYAPNRLNVKDTDQGGWFEGARWVSTGKWRSIDNSYMRSATATTFGAFNIALLEDRINEELRDSKFDI